MLDKKLDNITAIKRIALFAKEIPNIVNLLLENQIKKE
jgi:hypothetical protein